LSRVEQLAECMGTENGDVGNLRRDHIVIGSVFFKGGKGVLNAIPSVVLEEWADGVSYSRNMIQCLIVCQITESGLQPSTPHQSRLTSG
jgi:hypothetical protein